MGFGRRENLIEVWSWQILSITMGNSGHRTSDRSCQTCSLFSVDSHKVQTSLGRLRAQARLLSGAEADPLQKSSSGDPLCSHSPQLEAHPAWKRSLSSASLCQQHTVRAISFGHLYGLEAQNSLFLKS